ncbi:MAG: transcription antitermination factor NusB [Tenericutes bacterium]|nr:transcription antitermination factor NusB [Mycoplasmatota bacterium]
MKLTRTEAREKIMIILYQIDFYMKGNIPFDLDEVIKENLEMDNKYVKDIVNGVVLNFNDIDNIIRKYLENWDLERLGKTDKAILRLGTYEMIHYDTPKIVVINEAVELAKKYSDDKVVSLINAILDKIRDNEATNE